MSSPVIALRQVTVTLGQRVILEDLSVDLPLNGTTFIVGPSGSGKSTLCRAAVGLLHPSAGSIECTAPTVPAIRIDQATESALVRFRRRVPFVVQEPALLDWLSLEENVALAARAVHTSSPRRIDEEVAGALEAVGLGSLARRLPPQLGPGIRKRAAIARALVLSPAALMLDEPTTGLDEVACAQVVETLLGLRARAIGLIAISHDHTSLKSLADHVIEVREGRISYAGEPSGFLSKPEEPLHG